MAYEDCATALENTAKLGHLPPRFHGYLNSPEIIQALAAQIAKGKQNRTFLLILSPVVQVPVELEKLFVVLEHELPGRDQLEEIAQRIATEEGELPDVSQRDMLLDAAAGLTRFEAEGAFSLSRVRHGRIQPDAVWDLKCQTLKKSGMMQLYRGTEDFSSLGGLASLKAFTRRVLLQTDRSNPLIRPRGVLLLFPGDTIFSTAMTRPNRCRIAPRLVEIVERPRILPQIDRLG